MGTRKIGSYIWVCVLFVLVVASFTAANSVSDLENEILSISGEFFMMSDSTTVAVEPNLVGKSQDLTWEITVTADVMPVHEFRVYNNPEFTNFVCHPKAGWYGPYAAQNELGTFCFWTAQPGNRIQPGSSSLFKANATSPSTDCCRKMRLEAREINETTSEEGPWLVIETDVCVDAISPETEVSYIGPYKEENGVEWIDGVSRVNLTANDDRGAHPTGINKTLYRVTLVADDNCWDASECDNSQGIGLFQDYSGHFGIPEESCHLIEYYSIDNVFNQEDVQKKCVFVDKTPPEFSSAVGQPSISDDDNINFTTNENPLGAFHWVSNTTSITMTCEDQDPHPSGDEELCYKVQFDEPSLWTDITNQYCSAALEDGWCCVSADVANPYVLKFKEDSQHRVDTYCRDAVNKTSNVTMQYFKVDTRSPEIRKDMFGRYLGECPPKNATDKCYVADDNSSGVNISVEDFGRCATGRISCHYDLWWMGNIVDSGDFNDSTNLIFQYDSTHTLNITCHDALGNSVEDVEEFLVDSKAPETEKWYGEPFVYQWYPKYCFEEFVDECMLECQLSPGAPVDACVLECVNRNGCYMAEFINSSTPVNLNASDEKVGVNKTYWRNFWIDDISAGLDICGNPNFCHPDVYYQYVNLSMPWVDYNDTPFYKPEESCHVIEYYSVDKLGNTEDMKWQCVFVDNTAPLPNKTIGSPLVIRENETCVNKTTLGILSSLAVYDAGLRVGIQGRDVSIASNGVYVDIKEPLDGSTTCEEQVCVRGVASATGGNGTMDLVLVMDSSGSMDWNDPNDYRIDGAKALIDMLPSGAAVAVAVVDFDDSVQLLQNFTDNRTLAKDAVDLLDAYGGTDVGKAVNFTNQLLINNGRPGASWIEVLFTDGEQTPYDPQYTQDAVDAGIIIHTMGLGASVNDTLLKQIANGTGGTYTFVANASALPDIFPTLSLTNIKEVKVNGQVATLFPNGNYELCNLSLSVGNNTFTAVATDTENRTAQNEVTIERLSEARCNQVCTVETVKYITNETPITLECVDQEPHPVNHAEACFKVLFDNATALGWGEITENYCPVNLTADGFCCVGSEITLQFEEDSMHDLQYFCKDGLGNANNLSVQHYRVDSVPPTTDKTYLNMFYTDGTSDWIDTISRVKLNATDGGEICHVDNVTTYYRTTIVDESWCFEPAVNCQRIHTHDDLDWMEYTTPFNNMNTSCRLIEFYSVDELGNEEPIQHQCTFVDKDAPETTKLYDGLVFEENGTKWMNNETNISLNASDLGPFASGVAGTFYKVTVLNDSADWHYCRADCGTWNGTTPGNVTDPTGEGWMAYAGQPFSLPEESCHIIEYYSIDNVGKVEDVKHQCVFVDLSSPEPTKFVGVPKTKFMWDVHGDAFYNVSDKCWNGQNDSIDCWKTTLMTPISLLCNDTGVHPVDHERVCFNVGLDGDDVTADYCADYNGVMESDGYCCMSKEVDPFYFGEVSYHNLKYYCVDALGNKGDVDEEKFKVEDTMFEIDLNDKWNLISTPVKLLDDSMDEVFKDVADSVISVWTYDAVNDTWYVYSPDNDSTNDNLHTMLPGWGYWVLTNDTDRLIIGGSLMSPAMTPPSKPIKGQAWNLIGYYGADELTGYYGPAGNGKTAGCALYSLGDSVFDKGWSTLKGYWEPSNPYLWYDLDWYSNLDPGAGYWIFATEDGVYAPTTNCGMFGPIGPII